MAPATQAGGDRLIDRAVGRRRLEHLEVSVAVVPGDLPEAERFPVAGGELPRSPALCSSSRGCHWSETQVAFFLLSFHCRRRQS